MPLRAEPLRSSHLTWSQTRAERCHDATLEILADRRIGHRRACCSDLFSNSPQTGETRREAPATERGTGATRIDTTDRDQSGRSPREDKTLLGFGYDRFHAGTSNGRDDAFE